MADSICVYHPMKIDFLQAVLDTVLPERCAVCGDPLLFARLDTHPVCRECILNFVPIRDEQCETCGMPLISEHVKCLRCREREVAFDGNIPVFMYTGFIAGVVSRYKIHGQKRLASILAGYMTEVYRKHFSGFPIVPVPFRPAARKRRGWDQVEEIVRIMTKRYGIPSLSLLRRENTVPQKSLSYEQRLMNLQGTIRFLDGVRRRKNLSEKLPSSVVMIDDVFTTGATINECARVLKLQGVERVYSITLAIDP